MTKKEFEAKLKESKHRTCGSINKETYYDYLSKIYYSNFEEIKFAPSSIRRLTKIGNATFPS